MNKQQLLQLEKNAHLSPNALRQKQGNLATTVEARLEQRAQRLSASQFSGQSAKLRQLATTSRIPISTDAAQLSWQTAKLQAIRAAMQQDSDLATDEALANELTELETAADQSANTASLPETTLADSLRLDEPIATHPEFRKDLQAARLYRLGDAAGIKYSVSRKLINRVGAGENLTHAKLTELVETSQLSQDEAAAAGLASSLYHILDERPELVAAAKTGELTRAKDLVKNDRAAWQAIINRSETQTPGNIPVEDYADLLTKKVAKLFPVDALVHHLGQENLDVVLQGHANLSALRQLNPDQPIIRLADFDRLKTVGLPDADLTAIKENYARVVTLTRRYPGMKLVEILDSSTIPEPQKVDTIKRRVDLAQSFFAANPNLFTLDLPVNSSDLTLLTFAEGISTTEQTLLLANARTYQRVLSVTDDIEDTEAFVDAGLHSALAIATTHTTDLATRTGLMGSTLTLYQVKAKGMATAVTAHVGTLFDSLRGRFIFEVVLKTGNIFENYLKDIPGFVDFFGNQDFCQCEHCQSILGPAAYFVDLMCFVDETIIQPVFGKQPNHPLNLQTRRPDLWTTELTCNNISQPIPYLVIINEILENAIAKEIGFAGDYGDRAAVRSQVYQEALLGHNRSIRLPFHLPLTELQTYLGHFGKTLADVATISHVQGESLVRLQLNLSPETYQLITRPYSQQFVRQFFYKLRFRRLNRRDDQSDSRIPKFDLQQLLSHLEISRAEISELLASWFIPSTSQVRIRSEKRSSASIQNDIERIQGLTTQILHRMYQFVLLLRATDWRIGELDLVLRHLDHNGIGARTSIQPETLEAIAQIHQLQTKLDISIEELTSLWSSIPQYPIQLGSDALRSPESVEPTSYPRTATARDRFKTSLFDRAFNPEYWVEVGDLYPQSSTQFLHPGLAAIVTEAVDLNLHRLKAGLGVSDDQLYQLVLSLATPLGIQIDSEDDDTKTFALSHENLTLLYRHAKLAGILGLSIPDLFSLIALTPQLNAGYIRDLSDLNALINLSTWWATTEWSLAELLQIVRPSEAAPVINTGSALAAGANASANSSQDLATALIQQVQTSKALILADTVFAQLAPRAPVVTSRSPFNGTGSPTAVLYTPTLNGRTEAEETILLSRNLTIAEVIADWNRQATFTQAFQSDVNGYESQTEGYLSIRLKDAVGSRSSLTIVEDTAGLFTADTPQAYRGIEITEKQSRSIINQNSDILEVVDGDRYYRLAPEFAPSRILSLPEDIAPALAPLLQGILNRYHSESILLSLLPSTVNVDPSSIPCLVSMLGINLADQSYRLELQGNIPAHQLTELIRQLQRFKLLFSDTSIFDCETLNFVQENSAIFNISDFDHIDITSIQQLELFKQVLGQQQSRHEARPELQAILLAFDSEIHFQGADQKQLAAILQCDVGLLQSLLRHLNFADAALVALQQLIDVVALAQMTGLGGDAIKFMQSTEYSDLAIASTALQSAFRAAYKDEAVWADAIEPFQNILLSHRRDALVAYLTNNAGTQQFDKASDLYKYFLLDVEVDGCMRTSRVSAAIDTVQTYVHRCLMNLEETSPDSSNPIHVRPDLIPADEWEWRKNYRVWEANRKVFLYPENYLEPELRDDKTPLFRQLEEDLLAKEITEEAIFDAYARYLRGFDELSRLTIAGSYHDKDDDEQRDTLYLFGVTADEPPLYYYRRVENAHYGVKRADRSTHWGPWQKLDLQVPVRKVSPVVHQGQLYVFWTRYTTKPKNTVENGTSTFVGYQHRAYVEFSKQRLDGSWTTPQSISLNKAPFDSETSPWWYGDNGEISDHIFNKHVEIDGFNVLVESNSNGNQLVEGILNKSGSGKLINIETGFTIDVTLPAYVISEKIQSSFSWTNYTYKVTPILVASPQVQAPYYDNQEHSEPKEGYTLSYFGWDRVYPATGDTLSLRGFDFQMWSPLDLYKLEIKERIEDRQEASAKVPWLNPSKAALALLLNILFRGKNRFPARLVWSRALGSRRVLHSTRNPVPCFDTYSFASLLLDESNVKRYKIPVVDNPIQSNAFPRWSAEVTDYLESLLKEHEIADLPVEAILDVINGSETDIIIQINQDSFYLQNGVCSDGKYHLRRFNTSIATDIADILFNQGLDELLSTNTQLSLGEHETELELVESEIEDATQVGKVDFSGNMGTYLREIFFHIPFLLANHLNSQGRYAEAQKWYHYIFDPTATEAIQNLPEDLPNEDIRRRKLDRNWRYLEFRNLTLESFRAQLTDAAAIEQYKHDPFNPHAIARLRMSAYQKAIVMKYVDNLLDWGDDLFIKAFSLSNQEYLREATLKYVTAQEILGDRPIQLGQCREVTPTPKVLPTIKEVLQEGSEFLAEMESVITQAPAYLGNRVGSGDEIVEVDVAVGIDTTKVVYSLQRAKNKADSAQTRIDPLSSRVGETLKLDNSQNLPILKTYAAQVVLANDQKSTFGIAQVSPFDKLAKVSYDWSWAIAREVGLIFCIPGNARMLSYWDRVADRLYKLRHCQDIEGIERSLPLFAPIIDPTLLVAGRASGLSLTDILSISAGDLPPYRFRYLLEKAKSFTATVQSFGAALLSALEKRDAEELTKLRNIHQKNILALTTEVKKNELKIAEESNEIVQRRRAAAEYRHNYYDGLIAKGLSAGEITQVIAKGVLTRLKTTQAGLSIFAGISYLIPQLGSPFSLKYGGKEISDSATAWSAVAAGSSQIVEMVAAWAGLSAGYARREQGWTHQREIAKRDLHVIEKEIAIANLRQEIANRSLYLHETTKEMHDEVMEFLSDKFSNLGLYTHLSRNLQQLYRQAYNNALALAQLAEQAYRFERPGDTSTFTGGEWESARAGLLSGERLLIALQNMERRFIETNRRAFEINQSFSLTQIEPQALISLKETGKCEFNVPELYFDLFYPGQYHRRIRSIRLTIPCITGPYTNISAKLTLLASYIRKEPMLGEINLFEVPITGVSSISTSTGQGDSGVFELNFRDEKYLPFEGAGAVSKWRLELPSQFRLFDYRSINDVILNISYTAEDDGVLRQQVEEQNAGLEGSLLNYLSNNTLTRVFSMRQEFSNAFNRLVQTSISTPVTIDITERHFPLFLQGRALGVTQATVVLVVSNRSLANDFSLSINDEVTTFTTSSDHPTAGDFGGLPYQSLGEESFKEGLKGQQTITINNLGGLAAESDSKLSNTLQDLLLVVEYQLS